MLVGQVDKREQPGDSRFATVFLDFANTRSRQCGDNDFEDWYARTSKGKECLMGHKVRVFPVGFFFLPSDNFLCPSNGTEGEKQTPIVTSAISLKIRANTSRIVRAMTMITNGTEF